jgi:AraC-like DNA-binding protein
MLIDRKGRLWAATENGIFRKDGKEFHSIYNKGKVVCITQGPADTVYAGSNGYGLLIIANDHVERITTSDGLANNCVEAVTVNDKGNVIAATDQGIAIINRREGTIRNVYSPLGLMADTYNEDAIIRTTDGRIFLGSLRGLVELGKTSTLSKNKCYAPCISTIYVNDSPLYQGKFKALHLPYNQNNLRFNFSSFAYNDIESIIYSYWLEGIDKDWRPSTKESFALYTNLRPGKYRFHVRYSMPGVPWSEETVCDVYIAQPWYWTWWARLLYLLVIALFILYEWHQYQQRLSLRRQLDQRLTALYAVEAQKEHPVSEYKNNVEKNISEEKIEHTDTDVSPETKETAHEKAANQRNKEFLIKLDQLIQQNLLHTELDVNFIAKEMCVSYSTLHRRIKSLTGITANEYVRKHRLTKSMQLLRDGHNVTEVSILCGFNSPSYFTRCFKTEYGILPSEV